MADIGEKFGLGLIGCFGANLLLVVAFRQLTQLPRLDSNCLRLCSKPSTFARIPCSRSRTWRSLCFDTVMSVPTLTKVPSRVQYSPICNHVPTRQLLIAKLEAASRA